ncbi:pentapeptide repeat-containing protein [Poseidonocella pacifica]|nr:pentapeptide repeat-containing protein [Poseidonocella pacifica]
MASTVNIRASSEELTLAVANQLLPRLREIKRSIKTLQLSSTDNAQLLELVRTGQVDLANQVLESMLQTRNEISGLRDMIDRRTTLDRFNTALESRDGAARNYGELFSTMNYWGEAFTGRDFASLNFTGQDLSGNDFTQANLEFSKGAEANFSDAILTRSAFEVADFSNAIFRNTTLQDVTARLAWFNGSDFFRANLQGSSILFSDLRGADFSEADLNNVTLAFSDLRGAKFDGANMSGATLLGSNVEGATFAGTILSKTDVMGVLGLASEVTSHEGLCESRARLDERVLTGADAQEGLGQAWDDLELYFFEVWEAPDLQSRWKRDLYFSKFLTLFGFHPGKYPDCGFLGGFADGYAPSIRLGYNINLAADLLEKPQFEAEFMRARSEILGELVRFRVPARVWEQNKACGNRSLLTRNECRGYGLY